ncbi:ABC transporter permease [Halobacteriales archaeon QH_7_66_36]|nr:MAG: ABC transporter permease [Halobacteriales archaeon QH_7_66_36]
MSTQNRTSTEDEYDILSQHYGGRSRLRQTLAAQREIFRGERLGQIGLLLLAIFLFVGLFAPLLAPYDAQEKLRTDDGEIKRMEAPSTEHLLGTTRLGRDVLSQVLIGTRIALIVGSLGAFMSVFIGTNMGLISGYFGGWTDDILMRLTDIIYGVPFLPFVIVLVVILGPSLLNVILAIALVQWRSTARVIRSQVLTIKERPYIEAARAAGGSDVRVLYTHILPNVLPLVFLYGAFSVGWAVIAEASVSFLGFGDPLSVSWGKMLFTAYTANAIRTAWWWVIPPGLSINLLVISVFLIGRTYEKVSNPELRERE